MIALARAVCAPGRRHGQQAGQLRQFLALNAMEGEQIEI